MGAFHTGCKVENHINRSKFVRLQKVLDDTGSEYTWIPETKLEQIGVKREKKDLCFVLANREVVTRSVERSLSQPVPSLPPDPRRTRRLSAAMGVRVDFRP